MNEDRIGILCHGSMQDRMGILCHGSMQDRIGILCHGSMQDRIGIPSPRGAMQPTGTECAREFD